MLSRVTYQVGLKLHLHKAGDGRHESRQRSCQLQKKHMTVSAPLVHAEVNMYATCDLRCDIEWSVCGHQ